MRAASAIVALLHIFRPKVQFFIICTAPALSKVAMGAASNIRRLNAYIGTTDLLVAVNALGDSLGDPLYFSVNNSALEVTTSVPLPSSSWLILLGVLSLFAARKRCYS